MNNPENTQPRSGDTTPAPHTAIDTSKSKSNVAMHQFFAADTLLNGSKGLVYIGDRILVYRRDSNTKYFPLHLDLPGGGKDGDETPFDTFKREVMEEFGINIQPDDICYVRRYHSAMVEGEFAYFPVAKLSTQSESDIRLGDEGLRYTLMNIDDFIHAPDVWPGLQQKAKDYLNWML
jgi:8-oxo-dGTP diphosphatase